MIRSQRTMGRKSGSGMLLIDDQICCLSFHSIYANGSLAKQGLTELTDAHTTEDTVFSFDVVTLVEKGKLCVSI